MKKLLSLGLLSCMVIGFLFAQKISNLRSVTDPNSGNYIISFDLEGEADEHYQLSLVPYNDEIEIAEAKIRSIYGPVSSLAPGKDLQIFWNPVLDGLDPGEWKFRLLAEAAEAELAKSTKQEAQKIETSKAGIEKDVYLVYHDFGYEEIDIEMYERVLMLLGSVHRPDIVATHPQDDKTPVYFEPWDDMPILIGRISPVYPEFCRRNRIQGTVVLEVEVLKDGSIRNIHVRRSVPGFDEAAIEAVRKAGFIPGQSGGKPIDTLLLVPVEFKLEDGTPSGFVSWDKPPVLIGSISPVYPDSARVKGVQGTVVLEIEVLKDGSIRDIFVKRSVPGGLDGAAIEAVRKVRFEPALSEGKPIDVKLYIPVEFKLD